MKNLIRSSALTLAAATLAFGCAPTGTISDNGAEEAAKGEFVFNPTENATNPVDPGKVDPATEADPSTVPGDEGTPTAGANNPEDRVAEPTEPVDEPAEGYDTEIPEGESAEGGSYGDNKDDEDPMNEASSDEVFGPGMEEPDTNGNSVGQIPNVGWKNGSKIDDWPEPVDLAPYPNSLPELPTPLTEPNYQPWTSGRSIQVHNGNVFVVSTEANSLVVFSEETGKAERIVNVGSRPEQVVVAPDGTAYVTLRYAASVAVVPEGSSQVSKTVKVGTEPFGLALSPDAQTLYVAISGENRVVAVTADKLSPLSNVPVANRPRGVAVNPNGEVYFSTQFGSVTRFQTKADGALVSASSLALRNENPADVAMHQGVKIGKTVATRAFANAVNPATGAVYVAHVNANPGSPEQSLTELQNTQAQTNTECETKCKSVCKNAGGYGGTVCNNSCNTNCNTTTLTFPHIIRPIEVSVSVFDPGADAPGAVENASPVLDQKTGEPMTALCDKPLDVAHHPEWSLLFVACKGTDNVLVLNSATKDPMRSTVAELKVGHAPNAITFSADGQYAYVRNTQSYSISRVNLAPLFSMQSLSAGTAAPNDNGGMFKQINSGKALTKPVLVEHEKEIVYAFDTLPTETLQLGRRVFTFSRFNGLSAKGFFACETCHPQGGTEDKLVWFVKDGPRQTPMLAGKIKGTEPFNWVGTAETLQQNITNTVKRMGGSGLTDAQKDALSEFLAEGLIPPPNPNVLAGGLTESQKAGKELFYHPAIGCAECHAGETATDGENWDVGTFTDLELEIHNFEGTAAEMSLNTPSIKGLYYSAPYLHDGSSHDLYDVLNATSATMGVSMQLTGKQQTDLVNYLLTL